MRHIKTRKMQSYWMDLFEHAGGFDDAHSSPAWPERSDIQPAACRDLLPHLFILDVDNHQATYRLAGTGLCDLYGRELKGEDFEAAFADTDQRAAGNWVDNLGRDQYLVLICSDAVTRDGDLVALETLLAPLNHYGQGSRRALGITVALEPPHWIGAKPLVKQSIRSVRIIRPWETTAAKAFRSIELPPRAFTPNERRDVPFGVVSADTALPPSVTASSQTRPILRVIEGGKI